MNLRSRLDRLEGEISPPAKVKVTCTFAKSDEEVAELRKNAISQGEMYILTWLPPKE
ncbi:hypothetical protein [Mesorhizobium sp. KR9-304]|uniref:hypothetical protein n=1 Tax=Mesorhizobium sp. KR9-304 TaxID=3156614 RepID=UPI0032B4BD73